MAGDSGVSLQLRIGAFVLAALLVFLAIIYLLGAQARYFERKDTLLAEFTEVGGLIEGAAVRLAGVQIGRVTDVVLPGEPGGKVRVTLTIARRFMGRIRRDSEARIVTQGLLGDKLVEITLGSPAAPPLRPGDTHRQPRARGSQPDPRRGWSAARQHRPPRPEPGAHPRPRRRDRGGG